MLYSLIGGTLTTAITLGLIGLCMMVYGGLMIRRKSVEPLAPIDPNERFCRDCRWARWDRHGGYVREWKCSHPSSMRALGAYLESGEHKLDNMYSGAVVRTFSGEKNCGPEGKHWERRR